ncbi:MAG: ATP synthase subunit I [Candidatus Aminicenantales bacterium]
MDIDPLEEKILNRIPLEICGAALVAAIAALAFFGAATAVLVFAGGAFAAVGFLGMKAALTRLLDRGRRAAVRSGALLYAVRLILILAVFSFIIFLFPRKILAFGAGFSVLVPVFLAEGAVAFRRMKTWKN